MAGDPAVEGTPFDPKQTRGSLQVDSMRPPRLQRVQHDGSGSG